MTKIEKLHPVNGLLATLPADVCERLRPDLQVVELTAGKVLFESKAKQHAMYFFRSGLVSLVYAVESGDTNEIAMVGREGMVGVALLVDGGSTPTQAVVQIAGEALMLKAEAVTAEFSRGTEFQFVLLRYTQALLAQMAQMSVCNRHHTVEKQLARWLLSCADRIGPIELRMTQGHIADLLGVRREGVTEAARKLQEAGAIDYSRGVIRIVDRQVLHDHSCECYVVLRGEYERLLGFPIFD